MRSNDGWFAGVASGIATRANIDPLIVRGIFIVLAVFGGPGILLYVVGWLLLPAASGKIHLEELVRGRSTSAAMTVAIIIGAIVAIPLILALLAALFGLTFGAWTPLTLLPDWLEITIGVLWWVLVVPAAITALIIWLATRKPAADAGAPDAPSAPAATDPTVAPADSWAERAGRWGEEVAANAENEYEHTHPGAAHTIFTLAAALLASGGAVAWALRFAPDHVMIGGIIAAVTVFAISMIIAGVRGRRSGWTGFFAFCGVIALFLAPFSAVSLQNARIIPFGSDNTRITEDDHSVAIFAGNSTVDLRDLDSRSEPREVAVWVFAGNVTIELPDDHPIRVHVELAAGNIRDQDRGNPRETGLLLNHTLSSSTEGARDSEITDVHVRLMFGQVRVDGELVTKSMAQHLELEATR